MNNWKTTLTGVLGAAVILINKYSGLDLPAEVVIAVVIGIAMLLTKDYDTTGNGVNSTKDKT
jgi:hypothetical protein